MSSKIQLDYTLFTTNYNTTNTITHYFAVVLMLKTDQFFYETLCFILLPDISFGLKLVFFTFYETI